VRAHASFVSGSLDASSDFPNGFRALKISLHTSIAIVCWYSRVISLSGNSSIVKRKYVMLPMKYRCLEEVFIMQQNGSGDNLLFILEHLSSVTLANSFTTSRSWLIFKSQSVVGCS
jgi:hypothetical protein